jgi:uncharacterized membrane protein YbhN (UPF0104 family)
MTSQPAGKMRYRKLAVGIIEAACIIGIAWVIYRRRNDLLLAFDLDALDAVVLVLLCALAVPIRALEFRTATGALGVRVPFADSAALAQAATLLNFLPMQAGTLLRGRIMKARSLSFARYLAMMSCLVLLNIAAAAVIGLLALLLARTIPGATVSTAAIALGTIALAIFIAFLLPLQRIPLGHGWLSQRIRDASTGWQQIKTELRTILVLIGTSAASPVLLGLRFWICFSVLSLQVPLAESLLLGAAVLVAAPISVTPGGIGVREIIATALGAAAGLSFPSVLAAVTLDRVVSLLFSVVAGGASLAWLRRRNSWDGQV